MSNRSRIIRFAAAAAILAPVVLLFTMLLTTSAFRHNYVAARMTGYAVVGSQTADKLEYALKYGKPLDNFYEADRLLSELRQSVGARHAAILSPAGEVLATDGAASGVTLPTWLARQLQSAKQDGHSYFEEKGARQYWLTMPVRREGSGAPAGWLCLTLDQTRLEQEMRAYTNRLLPALYAIAAAAALGQLLLSGRYFSRLQDAREAKRFMVLTLGLAALMQAGFGAASYRLFADAYVAMSRTTTAVVTQMARADLERISRYVPYSRMAAVDGFLSEIVRDVPQLAFVRLTDASGAVVGCSAQPCAGDAPAAFVDRLNLSPDLGQAGAELTVAVNSGYIGDRLREIVVDTATVLVTSFLFMFEATLFLFLSLGGQAAGGDAGAWTSGTARPVGFLVAASAYLSAAFVPLVVRRFNQGLLWMEPQETIAFVASAEMLAGGLGALGAGSLLNRFRWRAVFAGAIPFMVGGMVLSGLATGVLPFVVARLLAGSGFMAATMSLRGYVSDLATAEGRSAAFSNLAAGFSAGTASGAVVGALLADRLSFGPVFLVGAGVVGVAALLAWATTGRRAPEERGVPAKAVKAGSEGGAFQGTVRFLANPKVAAYFLLIIIPTAICAMFLTFYLPLFAQSTGVSTSTVGRMFLIPGLCSIFLGPWLSRKVLSRFGPVWAVLPSGLILVAGLLIFAWNPGLVAAIVLVLLLGVSDSFGTVAQNQYLEELPATAEVGRTGAQAHQMNFKKVGQMLGPQVFGRLGTQPGRIALVALGLGLAVVVFTVGLNWKEMRRRR